MQDDVVIFVAEDDATQPNDFGLSRDWKSCVFAGAHGAEEANDCEFSCDECHEIASCRATAAGRCEHEPEEPWGDRFLSLDGRVNVNVSGKQLGNHGVEVGASFVVQGADEVTAPEQRSQMACGFFENASKYWFLTCTHKGTVESPR